MGNTPLWGVAHAVGGWGALGLRTSPTRQVGWDPAWWMGEVRKPSAPHPPTAWATPHSGVLPTPQVGRDQLPLSHKPTASVREPLPSMTEATSMGLGTTPTHVDGLIAEIPQVKYCKEKSLGRISIICGYTTASSIERHEVPC